MSARLPIAGLLLCLLCLPGSARAGEAACAFDAEGRTVGEIARGLADLVATGSCDGLEPGEEDPAEMLAARSRALEAAIARIAGQQRRWSCPEGDQELCRLVGGLELRAGLVEAGIAQLRDERPVSVRNAQFQLDFSQRELLVGRRGSDLRPLQLCRAILPDTSAVDDARPLCLQGLDQTCEGACARRVDALVALLPAVRVMETTVGWLNSGAAAADARAQRARADKWNSYILGNDASDTLWPWELWVNGLRHDWSEREPPTSYVSLIRPEVGLEFYRADGTEATLTGLVELVGYNRIEYTAENTREDRWGIGIVAGYGLTEETEELGYGIQFKRLPRAFGYRGLGSGIDVAVLYREDGDGVSVVFSRSLQSFFDEKPCAYFGTCGD